MKKLSVFYEGWGEKWQLGTLADMVAGEESLALGQLALISHKKAKLSKPGGWLKNTRQFYYEPFTGAMRLNQIQSGQEQNDRTTKIR
jgi:hypothetical protein